MGLRHVHEGVDQTSLGVVDGDLNVSARGAHLVGDGGSVSERAGEGVPESGDLGEVSGDALGVVRILLAAAAALANRRVLIDFREDGRAISSNSIEVWLAVERNDHGQELRLRGAREQWSSRAPSTGCVSRNIPCPGV